MGRSVRADTDFGWLLTVAPTAANTVVVKAGKTVSQNYEEMWNAKVKVKVTLQPHEHFIISGLAQANV